MYRIQLRLPVWLTVISLIFAASGGGSGSSPTPPPQDFAVAISPSSVTQQAGGTNSTFTLSVTGQNDDNDAVLAPISVTVSN